MELRVEALCVGTSILGEGPLWLPESKQLIWVDIEGKRLNFYTPMSGAQKSIQLDQRIGAVVQSEDGRLVCALENGFYYLDLKTETLQTIANPESHLPNNRFNDGKCDPAGRFWAGTMPMTNGGPHGALYRLDGDGSVHKMLEDIGCSNGLGWSLDGTTMYYIDTDTRRVDRFDYDALSGKIENRKTIVSFSKEWGYPDGMTVDEEGMLWVAHWNGSAVSRFDPTTGERIARIELPVSLVTSCCFGGENLDELYITTARIGLSEEQLQREPLAGSVFVCKPGVRGLQANDFKVL